MSVLKDKILGFDGKKALNNLTGIGNYSRFLINSLAERNPEAELMVFSPKAGSAKAKSCIDNRNNIRVILPSSFKKIVKEWWRCYGIASDIRKNKVSLFHGLSNEIPFGIKRCGIPVVVTVHDLIFLRYPKTFGFLARNILKTKVKYACRHADRIITISELTKKDLFHYYDVPPEKVKVIMQGCAARFYDVVSSDEIERIKSVYNLPDRYIVTVGTIEERKNHKTIINALAKLEDIHLVVISKKTSLQEELENQISSLSLTGRVHIINGVTNQDLPAVYQGASACVYFSFYEGFGIPVLEGMVSRLPVIAASGSCLEEVGGDACLYCSPFDCDSLAETIKQVLSDAELRNRMIARGIERAKLFSSEEILRQIEECYNELLS